MTKFRPATLKNINRVATIIVNTTVDAAKRGCLGFDNPKCHDVRHEVEHALKFFPQTKNIRKTLKQKNFLVGLVTYRLENNREFMMDVYKAMSGK